MKKVLLTSVCRPLGPAHGDAPSVGYELLHGQVTRAQGMFSPRSLHLHFSLEYVAENLEAACVVLQYPSKRELIAELKKGYDFVCVSFLLAVFHRMKEVVELVREARARGSAVVGIFHDERVRDVVATQVRYATALDARDWALLRTCFTPDAVGEYEGKPPCQGYEAIDNLPLGFLAAVTRGPVPAAMLAAIPVAGNAQETTSSIRGRVVDASGGVVAARRSPMPT